MWNRLRFPSKRQHNRFSEAWHCFPGKACAGVSGLSAAWCVCVAYHGRVLAHILHRRHDLPVFSPGQQQGDSA